MDERTRYVAIQITYLGTTEEELCEHLNNNGYDHYYFSHPYYLLFIDEDQIGYIDTILEDRNIQYEYV